MISSFKELKVWQKSFALVKKIYKLSKQLPSEEKYSLADQMKRAAESIPSNIAEDSKRSTRKDYVQFFRIANGSTAELKTQLLLANDLYNVEVEKELNDIDEIQKMLYGMIKKLATQSSNL